MISAAKAVRCSANGATILCSLFTTGQIPTIQCVDSEGIFLSEYRTGRGNQNHGLCLGLRAAIRREYPIWLMFVLQACKSGFTEVAMKNYTQVYVKNSFEAAETYCKAFGAEITREFKNEDNTAYEHCELSVNGEGFLALAEAKNPCDIDVVHKYKWETMTFNVFEMGTEEAVYNAFQVLIEGGVIIEPIGELPWSKCCATIIDKYGVCWWISI